MPVQNKALLLVYTEPGDNLTEDAYHEWYESEHIPLRMALPEFHSCSRLIQDDGKHPTYGATYDLPDAQPSRRRDTRPSWQTGATGRKTCFRKWEFLDRRLYVLNENAPKTVKEGYAGHVAGTTVSIVSIDVDEEHVDEFHKWYDEEHVPMLMKIPGWLRSRRYILLEEGVTGALKGLAGEMKKPPKFMAMHEFTTADYLLGPEGKAAISTPWREEVMKKVKAYDKRTLKITKTF